MKGPGEDRISYWILAGDVVEVVNLAARSSGSILLLRSWSTL